MCGPGEHDIVAIGSLENFPLLYHSMSRIDRAVRLRIISDTTSWMVAEKAKPGTCILTTSNLAPTQWAPLAYFSGVHLFRRP